MLDTFAGRLTLVLGVGAVLGLMAWNAMTEERQQATRAIEIPQIREMVPAAPPGIGVDEQRRRRQTVQDFTTINPTGDLKREARNVHPDRGGGIVTYVCEAGQHAFLFRPVPELDERTIVTLRVEGSTTRPIEVPLFALAFGMFQSTSFASRASLSLVPRVPRPPGELRVLHGYLYTELTVIAREADGRNARVIYRDRDLHMTDAMHRCAASQGRPFGQRPFFAV